MSLSERRALLQMKLEAQRRELGIAMASIDARITKVDAVLVKMRDFARNPLVMAAGTAFAWYSGPRRALRLAARAAMLIPLLRRVMRAFRPGANSD